MTTSTAAELNTLYMQDMVDDMSPRPTADTVKNVAGLTFKYPEIFLERVFASSFAPGFNVSLEYGDVLYVADFIQDAVILEIQDSVDSSSIIPEKDFESWRQHYKEYLELTRIMLWVQANYPEYYALIRNYDPYNDVSLHLSTGYSSFVFSISGCFLFVKYQNAEHHQESYSYYKSTYMLWHDIFFRGEA